jgi:hypothetical protein
MAAATLSVLALAGRAEDEALASRVESLVLQVQSADAGARKKALDAIRALGVDAIPHVLRAAGPDVASPEFDAAVAALVAIDPDQALAAVQTCRTEWAGLGFLAAPEDRKGRRVVDELEDRLLASRKAEWSRPVRLLPAELDEGFRVPPWAEERLKDLLPSHLAWADVPVREKGGKLEIDAALDGRFALRADPARALVVAVGAKERPRKVLVYRKLDGWYAASPWLLRGTAAPGLPVELLDVEGDGDFAGRRDLVRFGDDAFRPLAEGPFAVTAQGLVRFRVRRDAEGFTISVVPEPEPHWVTGPSRAGMDALNAWRADAGLSPHRIDRRRAQHCGLHHEYWRLNGFSAHDEDAARPGYTPEGERAGKSASCWAQGDGAEFVRKIGASILHRSSLVGRPDEGVGFFAGPAGALLWGAEIDSVSRGAPVMVPGPGQTGTPLACEPEEPKPSVDPNFYGRARGFPVSATWSRLADPGVKDRKLEVFAAGAPKPLAGTTFSYERPYNDGFRAGYPDSSVIFVSDGPLPAATTFTARLSATAPDGPVEVVWQFRTK